MYGLEDVVPLTSNNHEAIVLEVATYNYKVNKVNIDNGSAIDVLCDKMFKELQLEEKLMLSRGTIYQRLVNKLFQDHIGCNMKVYVNDILIKSRTQGQFISDLSEIFNIL
ncbi:uncharacterized protein LOC113754963 [Coffea eugenioides]|uniref:Uncharacterized protein n=1 Tax=Coffea arabica TaxID=13443 RepID=A0A6P6T1K3_COFAR|nr:uncharacterized protein LOC113696718 [Coffea arabica]XP_027154922.1 uncharacterized protein LOC113754963 [Coffea eugenioides]